MSIREVLKCLVTSLVLIVLFITLAFCGRVKRIIGGHEMACGTHPRVVSLRNVTSQKHLCGATLLSAGIAVTAAHCCYGHPSEYILQLNNYCTNEDYPRAKVLEIYIHEDYEKYSRAHDIALLSIDLDLDDIDWLNESILPETLEKPTDCMIAGYGVTDVNSEEPSAKLLAASVAIISYEECFQKLGEYMTPARGSGQMCAVGINSSDTCLGDSGGPILCSPNLEIRGISSYGQSCGCPGVPGVYTNVLEHSTWIRDTIELIQKTNDSKFYTN